MVSLLTLIFLHLSVIAEGAVAPGDEEQLCRALRAQAVAPIPAYSANMRVLMDSWNYQNLLPPRTGAVWDQVDNDTNNDDGITTNVSLVCTISKISKISTLCTYAGHDIVMYNYSQWIQNSNSPCQHTVQVCGFSAGPQSNWLITQLINRAVNGTRLPQVSVMIEFELRNCDVTLNCQRTFNTHVYETSSVNTTGARRNLNNYRQVQRVSPDITTGARVNETITINFKTNHSSFYVAIQDETSCMSIKRMLVFYYICPRQTVNLISHPEIIAPPFPTTENSLVLVTTYCVENAKPENGRAPLLICSNGGIWSSIPGSGCRCVAGYFLHNETCKRK